MKQKEANKARTNLLTFISKESSLYLRNNCSISNYVDEMDDRKVLFSKNKLKRHSIMGSSEEKERSIKIKENYNNKKSNIEVIKNGI